MSDPANPSGALPGDPRHGLTESQLRVYYAHQPACWYIHEHVGPRGGPKRVAALEPHIAYLRAHRPQIRFAGPEFTDDGVTAIGSVTLFDAPDRTAAAAYIASEPYNTSGAMDRIDIVRWSPSMQHRQLDYRRTPDWQQFLIVAMDRPDGAAQRRALREVHHAYQATVMDRYVARGPLLSDDGLTILGSLFIVEFPDRTACDAFWAAEPLNAGGVFGDVRITRWRYGAAIG